VSVAVEPGTRVVWKFPIPLPEKTGRAFIDVPVSSEFLSVGLQGEDEPFVWALVDPVAADEIPPEMRRLVVANTGGNVPEFPVSARFLGTVTTSNGIVWHVWDGDA
jgi:hypothetical protein